jgi:murein DD-endopeptidase MepM/ murein hydrolase activator NlpD
MDTTVQVIKPIPADLFVSKLPDGEKEFFCYISFKNKAAEHANRLSWSIRSTKAGDNLLIHGERYITQKERESCQISLSALLPPEFEIGELAVNFDYPSDKKPGTWKIMTYRQNGEFRLPLDGQVLIAMGHRIGEAHRSALRILSQQFGWDLLPLHNDGLRLIKGPLSENLRAIDFEGFGQAVLAPADGIVVKTVDGNPDLEHAGQLPENLDFYLEDLHHAIGNYVILNHGNKVWSVLGHLRHGSVQVTEGKKVQVADKIGELGNSGFSSGPHVHLHFMNGPDIFSASPLPIELNLEGEVYSPQAGEITSNNRYKDK